MSLIAERRLELAGLETRALELDPPGRGRTGGGARRASSGAPALLLLHGWADSADTWRPLLARLAGQDRRAVALDLPGFGRAGRLDRDAPVLPQVDAFVAAAVEREADRAGGAGVIIAGNSLGGCAGLRAAERDDLPLAGVLPIAPAGLEMARWFAVIEGEALVRWLLRAPLPLPELVVRDVVGRLYRTLAFAHPRAVEPDVVASFTRHLRSRRDVARALATGRRLLPELREPFRLERVRCPVVLVWGEQDRMVFATGAERVLREVAGARMVVIERCGHCPQIEAPEQLAQLIAQFPEPLERAA